MTEVFNKQSTKDKRRKLRANQTVAERKLWSCIRKDALGVRVRRQYGVGEYIVDFYIPTLKLAIEIDGDSHFTTDARQYDLVREDYMSSIGIRTIRYKNDDVINNIDSVFADLLKIVESNLSY
ncbi:endonuclease domain-containing protein [Francisella opportunistica]|uniref:Endonuclease domain-containing protein n=2 Tax=Francisellaceae TaxID=34064 RepID=A0A345JTP1_9GAMM|nr:endonuclease domain-containing protein [Francisella opportunistica]AXH30687.1 endonuclease domain-containing protein [Francisella opportunistica]AXH32327.1 endonuclease domain-containing protein [Francisella opportunistica]AXH33976.1 endonuclease domain-containing protein [Francisella opportunistica]